MKTVNRILATTVVTCFCISINVKSVQSNPAVLTPMVCATGAGCVLIGVAVVGGVLVWVWQNNRTQEKHFFKIEDAEEEMERMGKNAQNGRTIVAKNATDAYNRCAKMADGRMVAVPQKLGNNRWLCRYY